MNYLTAPIRAAWRHIAPSCPIWKTIWGVPVMVDLRDNALWWARHPEQDEQWQFPKQPSRIWDVGSNVGLYAVKAALLGHSVVAFDISPKACWMLRQTAAANGLKIAVVDTALSVNGWSYDPPSTAHTEEAVELCVGRRRSMTYLEAATAFGVPSAIKFDIQGAEKEFLWSEEFEAWMRLNMITWYLETHNDCADYLWPESKQVSGIHYVWDSGRLSNTEVSDGR